MGRRPEGYRIVKRGGMWTVRFRIAGKRHEYSTGIEAPPRAKRPSEAATRAGEQIYAASLQGRQPVARRAKAPGAPEALADLFDAWLEESTARKDTLDQYEVFSVQWLREWKLSSQLTDAPVNAYFKRRLREVTRKSVLNEQSAMRTFAKWAGLPLAIETIPKHVNGTAYGERRRTKAPELSPAEIEGILRALPEWSGNGKRKNGIYPVRARFELMWETTLRPETIEKLSVPQHWSPGERVLRITKEIDKEAHDREVPLTERAVKALERVAPAEGGVIFGKHKAWRYLAPVASKVLPAGKAAIFTGQHFRSAAITRRLEESGNLPGVMFLAGHRHASTTSKYARPSFRAAEDALGLGVKARPKRVAR